MEKAIFKTLLYSDLFDYPLTGSQIFQTIGIKITRKKLLTTLKKIPHVINNNSLYYFLPHRKIIVSVRQQREKYSQQKIQKAKKIAQILSYIPTIEYIGISGSVAMYNAEKESDIDFFFLTKNHTVWITRFLVYSLLDLLGMRRKGQKTRGSICANMFVSLSHARFPLEKRNVYIAHEIVQLLTLINKNNAYESFLYQNKWVEKYFPNLLFKKYALKKSFSFLLIPVEYIVRMGQLWYMREKKTREITTSTVIAFHPVDYEGQILKQYEKRLKRYGI